MRSNTVKHVCKALSAILPWLFSPCFCLPPDVLTWVGTAKPKHLTTCITVASSLEEGIIGLLHTLFHCHQCSWSSRNYYTLLLQQLTGKKNIVGLHKAIEAKFKLSDYKYLFTCLPVCPMPFLPWHTLALLTICNLP